MRLFLDTCVWGGAVPELRIAGHDVVWSGDWEEDPGDEAILASAHEQRRILVTLDKDFGELAPSSFGGPMAEYSGWLTFPRSNRRRCVSEYLTPMAPNWNPAPL